MDTRIEDEILRQLGAIGPGRSASPTDIAHALSPEWHSQLSAVRRAAIRLALAGRIDILRKGKPVPPETAKGVIRLRLCSPFLPAGDAPDSEPSNPEPANPEPANPEPANPEPANPEPANPEPANPEPA